MAQICGSDCTLHKACAWRMHICSIYSLSKYLYILNQDYGNGSGVLTLRSVLSCETGNCLGCFLLCEGNSHWYLISDETETTVLGSAKLNNFLAVDIVGLLMMLLYNVRLLIHLARCSVFVLPWSSSALHPRRPCIFQIVPVHNLKKLDCGPGSDGSSSIIWELLIYSDWRATLHSLRHMHMFPEDPSQWRYWKWKFHTRNINFHIRSLYNELQMNIHHAVLSI